MASLTKRPTSNFWVACFTDAKGRRLKLSTATTNRKKAQKIADEYEEAARNKRTSLQTRRVISRLHQEITGLRLADTTVRSFVEDWLARKKPETADSTHSFYTGAATKFLTFLGNTADCELVEISRDHILKFRNEESKRLAPKTVNHLVKFLRMVFRAAKKDSLISDDPAEFVETVRDRGRLERRPFSLEELRAVLAVADEEWKSMILFGLYTGQRLSDVACVSWTNIDLLQSEIRLVTRKTGKRLILPIAAPLRRHLESLPSSDNPDSPLHPKASAMVVAQKKSGNLSNQFADLLAQAGLKKKQPHRKTHGNGRGQGSAQHGLSFHCLRHTAVTLMKEAGVPAAVVMELIGHDSEQMSEHYTHVGRDAMAKAAESLPDVFGDATIANIV